MEGKTQEIGLNRIAMALDCEGTICFLSSSSPYNLHRPCVTIVSNNCEQLVSEVHDLCSSNFPNLNFKVYKQKKTLQLKIQGTRQIERFLKVLEGYLIAKREQAHLVLKFIEQRGDVLHKPQGERKYSKEDLVIVNRVRSLNNRKSRRYCLPETVQQYKEQRARKEAIQLASLETQIKEECKGE